MLNGIELNFLREKKEKIDNSTFYDFSATNNQLRNSSV